MIKISQRAVYRGPNPFSDEPVVVADLELTPEVSDRCDDIIAFMADFHSRWFQPDERKPAPASSERLVGFILEWSLAALTYFQGFLQASGYRRTGPDSFRVWLAMHEPNVSFAALALAVQQCTAVADEQADTKQLQAQLGALWQACRTNHPSLQARILMEAARARGVPWMKAWGLRGYWQFGWGENSLVTMSSTTNADGFISGNVVGDKYASKAFLDQLALPTPNYVMIDREEDIPGAIEKVGFPCVLKPVDMLGGKGIRAGLTSIEEVREAFDLVRGLTADPVMLEAFAPGSDHRIMAVGGKYLAAFRRDPPVITGDGSRTIRELTAELNGSRVLPGASTMTRFSSVILDEFAIQHLASQGMTVDSIPEQGRKITLRSNANLSTGGTSTDVSADVHPDIRMAAEMLARTLEINLAGFDYMTTDISRSWREVPGTFIELNIYPGLEVLTLAGWPPAKAGLVALGDRPARIPIDCLVVPGEVRRQAEAELARLTSGKTAGWASHDTAHIGGLALEVSALHPWAGAQSLLANRMAQRAILIASSQHLQSHGFPVDRADRIWNCDDRLPAEWLEVLQRSSASPVRQGYWNDALNDLAGSRGANPDQPNSPPPAIGLA